MAKIEEKVEELLKEVIKNLGYELYDVEYVKEGKDYFLRVFIDKKDGIDIEDCEKVNNSINDLLDKADYIKEQYFLEVSSPGVERVLRKDKHLQSAIGTLIEVKLFKPVEKNKQYQGILKTFNNQTVTLQISEEKDIEIQRKDISLIKTVYNWED